MSPRKLIPLLDAFRLNLLPVNHRWVLSVDVTGFRIVRILSASAVLCRRLLTIFILNGNRRAVNDLICYSACPKSISFILVLSHVARIIDHFAPLFDIYLLLIATTLYSSFL